MWQRDLRVRLWLGPLDRGDFDDFLPGGRAAKALAKWLALLTCSTLEYEVRLGLNANHLQGMVMAAPTAIAHGDPHPAQRSAAADDPSLGPRGAAGPRLGWDSYLCSRPAKTPPAAISTGRVCRLRRKR